MAYWTFNDFFELIFFQGEKLNFIFGFSLIQNEKVKSRYTYIYIHSLRSCDAKGSTISFN